MIRPEILEGKTKKLKVGCGTLFITLNYKENKPFEIFLNGSKMGGCRANQESLSRIITLLFRYSIPIDEVIDQLDMIKCPACTRVKAKLENQVEIKNFPTSCGDAVAKFLKEIK